MLKNHVFFSIKGKRWSDRHVTKKIVQQKKPAVEHLRKPHRIMSISIFFLHVHTCPFFSSCPFFRRVFDWFWIRTTRPTIWRWRKPHKTYLNFLWKTEVQEKRTHINLVFFSVVSSCMDIIWCKKIKENLLTPTLKSITSSSKSTQNTRIHTYRATQIHF